MEENKYRWLNKASEDFLKKDYLLEGQSLDERVDIICNTAEKILGKKGFAAQFKKNLQKGWYSLSTPVWANFGTERGLPISCHGCYIPDTTEGILSTLSEIGIQSKYGGGTSAYFGDLRPRGSKISGGGCSGGAVHFMQLFDKVADVISQGSTRRGSFAAYLPIEHNDIEEFLTIRSEGSQLQNINFGVCVSNHFMLKMIAGDKKSRQIWAKVLECRSMTGYPYIFFTDTINGNAPKPYQDKKLKIYASNLCTEITNSCSEDESFVCDLGSMNILHYEEWKNTNAIELKVYFLDAVMSEFIEKAKGIKFFERSVRFAERQRAIGIGWLGWHSFLQSKMIPFESIQAKSWNLEIAKTIHHQAFEASAKMAKEYGEPELLKGYGTRHITKLAIAPTKSSSFILGQVSEGIQPDESNYCVKDLAKGKFTVKNPYLLKLLEEKDRNVREIWQSIMKNEGSVQHLDFLSQHEKDVFKTFGEISPMEIITQAAQRQKYIDQSQSLNLKIHKSVGIKERNALILEAWRMGIKTLYYQMSSNSAKDLSKDILTCKSCES